MSTRNTLNRIQENLKDSMGQRSDDTMPLLAPVANPKDIGRRVLRDFGELALDQLIPDPDQPRVEFDDEAIVQLAQSIQEQGQLHPIRVRWSETHNSWLIISGERRYRAAKLAGRSTIDCYFHEGELTKTEVLEQQLIENLLRTDLRPMEEARAYQQLIELNGWTGKDLAAAIHIHASTVTRALALLKLPTDIQQLVEMEELNPSLAYELSKLPSPEQQLAALRQHQEKPMTSKTVRRHVRQRRGKPKERSRGVKQTFLTEEGWRVTVALERKANYHLLKQALLEVVEEVELRIDNNVMLS